MPGYIPANVLCDYVFHSVLFIDKGNGNKKMTNGPRHPTCGVLPNGKP